MTLVRFVRVDVRDHTGYWFRSPSVYRFVKTDVLTSNGKGTVYERLPVNVYCISRIVKNGRGSTGCRKVTVTGTQTYIRL